jgi:hypothetical protein
MSDAELITLIEKKIAVARRDIADLTPRGITLSLLNALENDARSFASAPR